MTSTALFIRPETPSDIQAIHDLTAAAFASLEISDHTEQFVIDALRAAGALSLSLVAELDGKLVGHIAISPITLSDGSQDWYGAGPLSVLPELQRQGIGSALMRAGLERLQELGARGCCLLAHLLPLLNGVDALLDQRASCTRFLTRRCDSDRWVGAQSHATALAGYHDPQEPRRGPGFSHLQQQAIHTSYGVQTPLL